MRLVRLFTTLLATFVCVVAPAHAAVTTVPAFSGSVTAPMYVTSPPGDTHRLFIVTRPGVIYVAVDGVLRTTPFLDIHSRVWQSGEAGMASMAFDPGYSNPASPGYGLFYVYFVQTPGSGQSNGPIHIEEFSADPAANVASASAPRLVLEIPHNDASNHYGGTLQFSPNDGLLYIAAGDGGGSDNQYGNAQSTKKSLLGKLLRIDPHMAGTAPYSIPDGNPYKGQPLCSNSASGTTNCPEILAYGLRNPFRWSFDRATGDIAIGDVGQSQYEEIDYIPSTGTLAGDNFGWPCREGPVAYKPVSNANCASSGPFVDPVAAYSHAGLTGSVAITGGVVVRDPALTSLFGRYLYADFYLGKIHSVQLAAPTVTDDQIETQLPTVKQLVSFGEDATGHVYIVSLAGSVSRIVCDQTCGPTSPPTDTGTPPAAGSGTNGSPPPDVSSGAAPTDVPVARDTTPPGVRIRAARVQDLLGRGHIRLSIACDERCLARTSGRVGRLALRGVLERIAAAKTVTIDLRASARVRRALRRRGSVLVTVRARDAAGNLTAKHLRIGVRR